MMENQPQDLMYALGHIQSSVESMGKKLDDFISEAKSGFKDLDTRISTLEKDRAKIIGAAVALSALGAIVVTVLLKVVFDIG